MTSLALGHLNQNIAFIFVFGFFFNFRASFLAFFWRWMQGRLLEREESTINKPLGALWLHGDRWWHIIAGGRAQAIRYSQRWFTPTGRKAAAEQDVKKSTFLPSTPRDSSEIHRKQNVTAESLCPDPGVWLSAGQNKKLSGAVYDMVVAHACSNPPEVKNCS